MTVSEEALTDWIERCWPPGGAYPRPPWDRSVFRELFESEQRDRAKAAESSELAQLRRIVERQGREIAKLRRELRETVATIADGVGEALPAWRESEHIPRYRGVWSASEHYRTADEVTHAGARWHASAAIVPGVKPGAGDTPWQLTHKSDDARMRKLIREELQREVAAR
jgi:hypothetical protein